MLNDVYIVKYIKPFFFFFFFLNSKDNLVFQDMFPMNVSCLEVVVWDEGAEVAILP